MRGKRALRALVAALGLAVWAIGLGAAAQLAQAPPNLQVSFRIIVVSSADRASRVIERLKQGADFAALARTESLDPSAAQGGLIGPLALSELRDDLQRALRSLAPGGISGVLSMPTGFAVVTRVEAAAGPTIRGREILALSAVGSVKATVSVDGFAEAHTALQNLPKPADWNQDPRSICEYRQQAVDRVKTSLARILAPEAAAARAGFSPLEIMEGHVSYGQLYAYTGDMGRAVEQFRQAQVLAQSASPGSLPHLDQMIAVAHLHKAQMDNEIFRQPGDRCLLSARPGTAARGDRRLRRSHQDVPGASRGEPRRR